VLPERLVLAPGARLALPLAVATERLPPDGIFYRGRVLAPLGESEGYTLFTLPMEAAEAPGEYQGLVRLSSSARQGIGKALLLRYSVRAPAETSAGDAIVLISPAFVSPPNYAYVTAPPQLCWSEPAVAGPPPLRFRAMVAGPTPADSGWITESCWRTPALGPGTYYWKVFVRDGEGHMNRTNQRPYAFKIR
jgi:hypothetical protein